MCRRLARPPLLLMCEESARSPRCGTRVCPPDPRRPRPGMFCACVHVGRHPSFSFLASICSVWTPAPTSTDPGSGGSGLFPAAFPHGRFVPWAVHAVLLQNRALFQNCASGLSGGRGRGGVGGSELVFTRRRRLVHGGGVGLQRAGRATVSNCVKQLRCASLASGLPSPLCARRGRAGRGLWGAVSFQLESGAAGVDHGC